MLRHPASQCAPGLNHRAEAGMGCVVSEPLAMPDDERGEGGLKATNPACM
jgi:hypothetical protein